MKKKAKYLFLLLLTWFAIHQIIIIYDGLQDDYTTCDVAVILGNTVNRDGSLSDKLKSRLDKGLDLYISGRVNQIMVSGGLGKEGHYEGTKMAEYLIRNNVLLKDIVIDNNGINTRLTAQNTKLLIPDVKSVIVVSQYYHITRCKLAFRQEGIGIVQGAHSNFYEIRDIYALFREFFAYYKYLVY